MVFVADKGAHGCFDNPQRQAHALRTWGWRGDAPDAEWPQVADAVIEAKVS